MKTRLKFVVMLTVASFVICAAKPAPSQESLADSNRTVLPMPTPEFKGKIGANYKESTPDWRPAEPLSAPKGAPNVIMIVLDDVGFGHLGCYGGPVETPTACSSAGTSAPRWATSTRRRSLSPANSIK